MEINDIKYWVECSGDIEDFFEANNCVKIPSSISKNFVNGINSFDKDGFHYNKVMFKYDEDDELIVKRVVYGLKDEKLFRRVYDKYKNLIMESIFRLENEYRNEPIEKHYELFKHTLIMLMETQAYCRLFDLPTESLNAIKIAMDGIDSYLKTEENISNEETKVLKSLLWNGQDMLNTIVPFELHEITKQENKNMKEKFLIVIDCQNDFISGSLKNNIAESKIPNIVKKIKDFTGNHIFVTKDTHFDEYLRTREGVKLPVKHCIDGTWGWSLHTDVSRALSEWLEKDKVNRIVHYINKPTFGSYDLAAIIDELDGEEKEIDICGFCTDICVISNALILKERMYSNADIHVYDDCCAGVTEGKHNAALLVMESCQINVHWHEDNYGNEIRPKFD